MKEYINLIFGFIFMLFITACEKVPEPKAIVLPQDLYHEYKNVIKNNNYQDIRIWWKVFNDPQLDSLIEKGLSDSLDLQIAKQRIDLSKIKYDLSIADMGINVGLDSSNNVALLSADDLTNQNHRLDSKIYNRKTQIGASWELDLFDEKKLNKNAAYYAYLSEIDRTNAAKSAISSLIALKYFDIIKQVKNKQLIDLKIKTTTKLIAYAKGRFNAGQATQYDILDLEKQIELLKLLQIRYDTRKQELIDELAVLIGKKPSEIKLDEKIIQNYNYQNLPLPPDGQSPANLLNRPDVLAAQNLVNIRLAQRDISIAEFYPKINLNFALLEGKISLSGDAKLENNAVGNIIGVDLQLPIFTNGRLGLNYQQKDAELNESLLQYRKVLLNSLLEVESSYRNSAMLNKQNQHLNESLKIAKKELDSAQQLFKYGKYTFEKIPESEFNLFSLQERMLENQDLYIKNLIGLYKSLGGGW